MGTTLPELKLRRSQLYRLHKNAGARFEDYDGALCVSHYFRQDHRQDAGHSSEISQARDLGLADLSTLSRIGFKGRGAPDWLQKQGARLPEKPNQALIQADGSLLARLSEQEALVLRALQAANAWLVRLQDNAGSAAAQHAYLLPRADSHCWLALTGEHAAQTLAKVCAVDLRLHKFAQGDVAQTSVARVNAIVIRCDLDKDAPCFYLLCDVSFTEFLWTSLIDAMQEFGGQPVGLTSLRQLTSAATITT